MFGGPGFYRYDKGTQGSGDKGNFGTRDDRWGRGTTFVRRSWFYRYDTGTRRNGDMGRIAKSKGLRAKSKELRAKG